MREPLTRERLRALMDSLARSAPADVPIRVYFIGGATAVDRGWRPSTIDADLSASDERLFARIQQIKERLRINVELVRPEDFVPPLSGSEDRHLFIAAVRQVRFFHYDPYAQLLSKIVRGFRQDLEDAARFVEDELVDLDRFRELVHGIPDSAYSRYPSLSPAMVEAAVEDFSRDRS